MNRKLVLVSFADCPAGTFGNTCSQQCHCRSGTCDIVTGICEEPGCENWWILPSCSQQIGRPTFLKLIIPSNRKASIVNHPQQAGKATKDNHPIRQIKPPKVIVPKSR